MNARWRWCLTMVARLACSVVAMPAIAQENSLAPPSAFTAIGDERTRSVALFAEAAKVIQHPRCLNCHPRTRQPTQGDDLHAHIPPMHAGPADHGTPALPCSSCHGDANVPTLGASIASVPGQSHWSLAPAAFAWQGRSPAQICEQIKDRRRNGGRSLAQLHEHTATDALVGWAWHPGDGRVPAPGTQAQFAALIDAWIASGAHCPDPGRSP
jgi:hypothetical protein